MLDHGSGPRGVNRAAHDRSNPRTPLASQPQPDEKSATQDLKNLSNNKEVSDTIRKPALKMCKQKMEEANKK